MLAETEETCAGCKEKFTAYEATDYHCKGCGEIFCNYCTYDIRGTYYCEKCFSERIKD